MIQNQMTDQYKRRTGPSPQQEEEFGLLMSMALDELLDREEEERFHAYLSQYEVFADEWKQWQELDREFTFVPSALPPDSFLEDFQLRLLQQTRRRRLWMGVGIGSLAMTLWLLIVAGTISLGAYVLFNQADWLMDLVHRVAYLSVTVDNWFLTVRDAVGAIVNSQQAMGLGLLYLAVAVAMLAGWVMFLRRTIRPLDESAVS